MNPAEHGGGTREGQGQTPRPPSTPSHPLHLATRVTPPPSPPPTPTPRAQPLDGCRVKREVLGMGVGAASTRALQGRGRAEGRSNHVLWPGLQGAQRRRGAETRPPASRSVGRGRARGAPVGSGQRGGGGGAESTRTKEAAGRPAVLKNASCSFKGAGLGRSGRGGGGAE